jgi:hypothetical protein
VKEPQIPAERWIKNLLEAANTIADKKYQETRWLALDGFAWESPDEAINTLDDCVLDGFIEQFAQSFSEQQAKAVTEFRDEVDRYCKVTPPLLVVELVLIDPRWEGFATRRQRFSKHFGADGPQRPASLDRHSGPCRPGNLAAPTLRLSAAPNVPGCRLYVWKAGQ